MTNRRPRVGLLLWGPQDNSSLVNEAVARIVQRRVSCRELSRPKVKFQTWSAHRIRCHESRIVDGLREISHGFRASDLYCRYGSLKSLQRIVGWHPQLAVIGVFLPLGLYPSDDDRVERFSNVVTPIEHRGERDLTFITQSMPNVHGLLVAHLPLRDEALHKGASQRSRDADPGRPHGRVTLIHAGHHAVVEGPRADA